MKIVGSAQRGSAKRGPRTGSAAIEFAILGPLLIVLLMGMVVYGGWFWLAQGVQSLATESARAALGGLDAAERTRLATAFVAAEAGPGAGLDPQKLTVAVESDVDVIRVKVVLDASQHPVLAFAALLPQPPSRIERTAVVRIGGF
ncbi:MAG: TadE/TadG family type IV pilus assembly protein [Pseudomonadota bacterium]